MPARAQGGDGVPIERVEVSAYVLPTNPQPESDGTLEWSRTVLVLVELSAGGQRGLGYTYAEVAAAHLIRQQLVGALEGQDALDIPARAAALVAAVRNQGREGVAAMAISAVDCALWDLKARLLGVPLVRLLGSARASVPLYGSGGFTSLSRAELQAQLGGWAAQGISRVKMKVGRQPEEDLARVCAAREAIGPGTSLFVDANGAYTRKQALDLANRFLESGVTWFEEPVSSDDLEGLRLLRDRVPAPMEVAAGEYGYHPLYFRRMLEAQAVDVLQADATRCLGVSGFLKAAALCEAYGIPLSAHCAPAQHLHVCLAAPMLRHLEYFHDHVRIEHLLFDGAPAPRAGALRADLSRPGMGLDLKRKDAERFRA